jgi:hypothetical protein
MTRMGQSPSPAIVPNGKSPRSGRTPCRLARRTHKGDLSPKEARGTQCARLNRADGGLPERSKGVGVARAPSNDRLRLSLAGAVGIQF